MLRNSGLILVAIVLLCPGALPNVRAQSSYADLAPLMEELGNPAHQSIEAFPIFDDFYYVGMHWVAAYVLDTGDGLVVIDALYGDWVEHIVRGIEKLGLDPNDIKYVLCTHGHFDHAGGAKVLQDRYGAKVLMTAEDIELATQSQGKPVLHFDMAKYDVAEDGDVIELGNKRITLYKTPGHTWGAMSIKYEVTDGSNRFTAMTLGGVGRNFSGVEQTEAYIASYQRLIAMQDDIQVSMPNHAFMAGIFERRGALEQRKPGELHPFVDPDGYKASLALFLTKAQEKLVREQRGDAADPVATLIKLLTPLVESYRSKE